MADHGAKSEHSVASQTIRVNVGLLENLITSVSELVLARNQLLQISRNSENDDFKVPLQRLNHVTSELQEGLMRTRMQPVGNAWAKLPRIVRDLAQELGKEIELDMVGAETELDRQVIEVIKDPLMHMVRNSADHGLETPQDRTAAGKPKKGRINLKAYHAGGHVVIEISDNGRGLNLEKISQKIVERGLSTAEEVAQMSDSRIYNYIFAAGFSTAEKITNVSGRGVGMDVVRTNIEKIGGTVEVHSNPGQGSIFTVKIPLTLAIVSALIIRSFDQKFAIPQVSIIELVQASSNSEHKVEYIKGHPVLRLRNKLLPLITLSQILELQKYDDPKTQKTADFKNTLSQESNSSTCTNLDEVAPLPPEQRNGKELTNTDKGSTKNTITGKITPFNTEANKKESLNRLDLNQRFIVVAQVGSGQFGIIVDEVYDTEEIVVKPVSPILRQANIFAGNTILGDGSVVMILDPKGVAGRVGEIHGDSAAEHAAKKHLDAPDERRMRFLIFKAGEGTPKAVPLSLVVRLEEIETNTIENSNGTHVIQYRDRLMPLTAVQGFLDYNPDELKPVLVFSQNGEYAGLMVDEIIDIIEERLEIKMSNGQGGTYGSVVMAGKTTDLVDIDYFIQQIYPNWQSMLNQSDEKEYPVDSFEETVCFIDSCNLYRNLITPLFELRKIQPFAFTTAAKVLNYLEEDTQEFSAIILDKDSFGNLNRETFFENYQHNFGEKPCFIIGNHFKPEDEVFFQNQGCIACLSKADRESIMATVTDYLEHARSIAA